MRSKFLNAGLYLFGGGFKIKEGTRYKTSIDIFISVVYCVVSTLPFMIRCSESIDQRATIYIVFISIVEILG